MEAETEPKWIELLSEEAEYLITVRGGDEEQRPRNHLENEKRHKINQCDRKEMRQVVRPRPVKQVGLDIQMGGGLRIWFRLPLLSSVTFNSNGQKNRKSHYLFNFDSLTQNQTSIQNYHNCCP